MRIRQPCSADWNAMIGDEIRRFCPACSKHVTNIDALDDAAFAALVAEGAVCVRGRGDRSGFLLRAAALLGATAAVAGAGSVAWGEPTAASAARAETAPDDKAGDATMTVTQGLVALGYLDPAPPPANARTFTGLAYL